MNTENRHFLNKKVTVYTFYVASLLAIAGSGQDLYFSGSESFFLKLINYSSIAIVIFLNILLLIKLITPKIALLCFILTMIINLYSASLIFPLININGTLSVFYFRETLLIILFLAASSFLVSSYLTILIVISYVGVYTIITIKYDDKILLENFLLINLVFIAYGFLVEFLAKTISTLINSHEEQNEKISKSLEIIAKQNNELVLKNAELEKQKELLAQANHTKDKFFAIISHDLKSPFNSILGLTELLKDKIGTKSLESSLRIINSLHLAGKNAYKLVVTLLDWAQSQNGTIGFNPSLLNLYEVLDNIINHTKTQALNKEINLNSEISKELKIYADGYMLETILRNILSNAIKYSHKGSSVSIKATEDSKCTIVAIIDNGIGMDEQQIKRLFELNTQKTKSGTENETGTGLGLLLCADFTEKHKGTIAVESKPGIGTVFNISFPKPDAIS